MEKYNYHTDMGKPYNLPQTPFPLPIITIKVLVAILKQVSRCLNGIPHTLIYTNPGATCRLKGRLVSLVSASVGVKVWE